MDLLGAYKISREMLSTKAALEDPVGKAQSGAREALAASEAADVRLGNVNIGAG